MLKHLSITTKIVALSAILAAIFLGSSMGYVIIYVRELLLESAIKAEEAEVAIERGIIETRVDQVHDTVYSLASTPPIQGMFRAKDNDNFDELENSTFEQWRNRLETIFESEMNASKLYDQLRYIDETGQEIVRVNYSGGRAVAVPAEGLQNKADRPYFQQAVAIESTNMYVSRAELNREGTPPEIQFPIKPVVRYAVPVFDPSGKNRGIIMANVLFHQIIQPKEYDEKEFEEFAIVDQDGNLLAYPLAPEKEWGGPNDLNTGDNLADIFPILESVSKQSPRGSLNENNTVLAYEYVNPNPLDQNRYWLLFSQHPDSEVFAAINAFTATVSLTAFGVFMVLFFVFLFVIRRILARLKLLAEAAEKIGKGNFDQEIPNPGSDEIGVVAKAFNGMVKNLSGYYGKLEADVKKSTKQLDAKVIQLEKTKQAMFNVIEDLDEERQRANVAVQDLEKFKLAVEEASDHIIITDADGTTLYANKAAEKLTGFTKKEIIGRKAGDHLWGRQMPDEFYKKMWHTIKVKKKSFTGELTNRRKNGMLYEAVTTISPILNDKGEVEFFVGIERDITKEKEVDRMKTEFVSLASHQLRTPLSAIKWFLEMTLDGDAGKLNKEQHEYLQQAFDSNERMIKLVNDLLNVSRIEMGRLAVEPAPTDLVALCKDVITEVQAVATTRNQKIAFTKPPKLGTINIDPKLIRQVVLNFLSNASKYTPEKGKISLKVEKNATTVRLSVTDSGMGIPKAQQDKIFQKFFRADNVRTLDTEGTGLGLYVAKQVIEVSGGSIGFSSEENKGSTFWFTLPLRGSKKVKGEKSLA